MDNDKKEKSISALDQLYKEVGMYESCKDFKKLLGFIKRFPNVAPYNAMLLHIQKPGTSYVATAQEWHKKFNREIKPGARPLIMLKSFGPVEFLFELGDTIGDDNLIEELKNPFIALGNISDRVLNNLIRNIKKDGVMYYKGDFRTDLAGRISTSNKKFIQQVGNDKKPTFVKILFELGANDKHSNETKVATIAHELGHLYCGHLGTPYEKWWKGRTYLSEESQEFEAESVCWLICERLGIENPSAKYLSGYLKKNNKIPKVSIENFLKAVGIIEVHLKGNSKIRQEIIVNTQ